MWKWTVALVVVLCLFCGLGIVLLRRAMNAWGRLYEPTRTLRPADLGAIESTIGLELPNITVVQSIALLHGKDTTLFLKLVVPEKSAESMFRIVEGRCKRMEPERMSGLESAVPWFRFAPGDRPQAFRDPNGFSFAFCQPRNGAVEIFILGGPPHGGLWTALHDIFDARR